MKKVTGLGGIFFKCKDKEKLNAWYAKNLGLPTSEWGTKFEWRDTEDPEKEGTTVWSPFKESTTYFEPSPKEFMINYIVDDIEGIVEELKKGGVTVLDEIQNTDYGKFVHILDPENNKIELWQAND